MQGSRHTWTDQRIDEIIGSILRGGVVLSAIVVMAGGALYLARHGMQLPSYHVFRGEPSELCSLSGIMKEVLDSRGRGIIQLGLLILIATPVVRVAFTILAFALQRDRTYVIVTLIVFAVLLFSLSGGGQ